MAKYPNSKRAGWVSPLMLDQNIFDDRIKECGGDEGFLYFFTAQVMEGVAPRAFCEWYSIPVGLLGAWILEEPERLARYEGALKWVADDYVHEAKGIASTPQMGEIRKIRSDGSEEVTHEDMLGHRKLQVDTNLKIAQVWDRKRFGTEKVSHGAPMSIHIDAGLIGAASELLARIRGPVELDVTPDA